MINVKSPPIFILIILFKYNPILSLIFLKWKYRDISLNGIKAKLIYEVIIYFIAAIIRQNYLYILFDTLRNHEYQFKD